MYQLNIPRGSELRPTYPVYKITPWVDGIWVRPLVNPDMPEGSATSQNSTPYCHLYSVFDGDVDIPNDSGMYYIQNNTNGYLNAKTKPSSFIDTLVNPSIVLPPGGTGHINANRNRIGFLSKIAGWDNISSRVDPTFNAGLRGSNAGIYIYDYDDKSPASSIATDLSSTLVYDSFDLSVLNNPLGVVPSSPTKTMMQGQSPISLTSGVQFFSLPIPTIGRSSVSISINCTSGPALPSLLQLALNTTGSDQSGTPSILTSTTQLWIKNSVSPPFVMSCSCGSGLGNLQNATIIQGGTQFSLSEALFLQVSASVPAGTFIFTINLTVG